MGLVTSLQLVTKQYPNVKKFTRRKFSDAQVSKNTLR